MYRLSTTLIRDKKGGFYKDSMFYDTREIIAQWIADDGKYVFLSCEGIKSVKRKDGVYITNELGKIYGSDEELNLDVESENIVFEENNWFEVWGYTEEDRWIDIGCEILDFDQFIALTDEQLDEYFDRIADMIDSERSITLHSVTVNKWELNCLRKASESYKDPSGILAHIINMVEEAFEIKGGE